jgi:hypothetical protein
MPDEMNGDTPESACCPGELQRASRFAEEAMGLLPTLQRNALRKLFDRHDFLPEEVALLGYKRLQQADSIGTKGLAAITDWLSYYGFEMKPPPPPPAAALPRRTRKSIEQALRLLRRHGYEVVPQSASDRRRDERS